MWEAHAISALCSGPPNLPTRAIRWVLILRTPFLGPPISRVCNLKTSMGLAFLLRPLRNSERPLPYMLRHIIN